MAKWSILRGRGRAGRIVTIYDERGRAICNVQNQYKPSLNSQVLHDDELRDKYTRIIAAAPEVIQQSALIIDAYKNSGVVYFDTLINNLETLIKQKGL